MSKKPAIPSVPVTDQGIYRILQALKEHVETTSGARGGAVQLLADTATLADVITTLNKLISQVSV